MRFQSTHRAARLVPALLAAILFLNVGCVFAAFQDSTYRFKEDFSKTYPLAPDGTFRLENTNGIVRVTTWAKSEVEIIAQKSASRESDLARLEIKIEADPRSVSVDTIYPRRPFLRAKVTYEIHVPEGIKLERVRTTNGNIELTGRYSDVKAGTTNGDVRLDSVVGARRLVHDERFDQSPGCPRPGQGGHDERRDHPWPPRHQRSCRGRDDQRLRSPSRSRAT